VTNNNTAAEMLLARFEPSEVLHFEGRGGRTFDYIEDETVMDRLDAVLGVGASSFDFDVITPTCVRGTMVIQWPNGERSHYQDFGYATRADSAEPLKEAVSDAIRRLGRYAGVARYLYHKHDSQRSTPDRPAAPARPSAPQRPVPIADVPEEPDFMREEFAPLGSPATAVAGNHCPVHDVPWAGGPGDYWHKDPDGKYCRHPDNIKRARAS